MNWVCAECSGEGPWRTQRPQSCCCARPDRLTSASLPPCNLPVPDLLSASSYSVPYSCFLLHFTSGRPLLTHTALLPITFTVFCLSPLAIFCFAFFCLFPWQCTVPSTLFLSIFCALLSRMICLKALRKLCSLRFPQCLGHHHHVVYMIGFYMNKYKYFSCYWSTCSHTQTHIHTYIGRIQFLTIGLKINQFILTSKFLLNFSMEVDRTVPVPVLLLNLVIIAKGNHCAFYLSCCWIAILAHKNGNGKFKGQL